MNFSVNEDYSISEEADFHLLDRETVHSILALPNQEYLCTAWSGSLEMIDLKTRNSYLFMNKFKGDFCECMIPFPGFEEKIFPLILIKYW